MTLLAESGVRDLGLGDDLLRIPRMPSSKASTKFRAQEFALNPGRKSA